MCKIRNLNRFFKSCPKPFQFWSFAIYIVYEQKIYDLASCHPYFQISLPEGWFRLNVPRPSHICPTTYRTHILSEKCVICVAYDICHMCAISLTHCWTYMYIWDWDCSLKKQFRAHNTSKNIFRNLIWDISLFYLLLDFKVGM